MGPAGNSWAAHCQGRKKPWKSPIRIGTSCSNRRSNSPKSDYLSSRDWGGACVTVVDRSLLPLVDGGDGRGLLPPLPSRHCFCKVTGRLGAVCVNSKGTA